ncbi:LacI family DNA-binding transcriptional regulator [Ulvibacter antarcticus]|uniref:LacI family transcriptional regulator n=1 Tax=Ulvibacter antarcticus TaxID=442714 RepID=A0A3L9YVX3_9FLAO|nr:LacI family DNA-binding transcriptional regulator [Ulvibacter antarcticus]RMA64826.1 LacI family transcriptional regulator [Ulvibacter antarcticus]
MNQKNASINLKELSHLTGFSISTVSKALNNRVDISLKTKEIVVEVAKKHNYVPNSFAVGLRKNKSHTVAVILPQVNVPFYGNLLFYFHRIADCLGYRLLVFQSFKSEKKEIEYLKNIGDGSIDGAIVITNKKNKCPYNQFSVPVLTIPIFEAEAAENLERFSFNTFEKFLVEIN